MGGTDVTRLPLADLDQQSGAIRRFVERRGRLNIFALLANAPKVFGGWAIMVDELLDSTTFSPHVRELVIIQVAAIQRCEYELGQHLDLARSMGVPSRQIDAVLGNADVASAGFTPTEAAMLRLVDELCTTRRLEVDTFDDAHRLLGDDATTELLMVVSLYYGLALVANAADLALDTSQRLRV
jgi:4-carboxymuconolactone decarboxylase